MTNKERLKHRTLTYRREIIVNTRFTAFHRWKDAPSKYAYLQSLHRHEFHVKLWKRVSHSDREIEFIDLKNQITDYVNTMAANSKQVLEWSCEQWALDLFIKFDAIRVEVYEDGENGGAIELEDERSLSR